MRDVYGMKAWVTSQSAAAKARMIPMERPQTTQYCQAPRHDPVTHRPVSGMTHSITAR